MVPGLLVAGLSPTVGCEVADERGVGPAVSDLEGGSAEERVDHLLGVLHQNFTVVMCRFINKILLLIFRNILVFLICTHVWEFFYW